MSPLHLHELGYWLVPWFRDPRRPAVKGFLAKRYDPAGFVCAYGGDLDWAIRPVEVAVLDLEMKHGLDGVADMARVFPDIDWQPTTRTKSGGFHVYYRQPEGEPLVGGHFIAPGIECKAVNGTVHVPPSMGYTWRNELPAPGNLPRMPQPIVDAWRNAARPSGRGQQEFATERYPEGQRRRRLCSMAGKLRGCGLDARELFAALIAVRDNRCESTEGITDDDIRRIATDYGRKVEKDTSWFPGSD